MLALFKPSVKHSKALKHAHNHRYTSVSLTSRRHQCAARAKHILNCLHESGPLFDQTTWGICENTDRLQNLHWHKAEWFEGLTHPAFSLCLNWFKRRVPHVLKVRSCEVPQCALVSVHISVGLRHAMTETFGNCHFWTCFAMSKPKETMCRIRLWTNTEQTADRTEFGRKPKCLWKFNQLYPQACTSNEQFVSHRGDFNWHHTTLPNFHPTADPMPEPAGSAVSHQPLNLRVQMLSTTSWEKGLDAFWFGKVSFWW